MKKNQFALSLIALTCFSLYVLACPALATEPTGSAAGTTGSTNEITPQNGGGGQAVNSDAGKSNQASKSSLPKKIFSVATAFVIGTPVCIVRRSKYEEWYGIHGMIGDSESKCKKILAGTLWLPFAVITGTLEAPFDATTNGLIYPAFSKDQLSQGKLVQNN